MASKLYAYYITGGELAIVEYDETKGNYKSPLTSVNEGVEIEYVGQPYTESHVGENYIANLEYAKVSDGNLLLVNEAGNNFTSNDENKAFLISNLNEYPELNGLYKTVAVAGTPIIMQCVPINGTLLNVTDTNNILINLFDITQVNHIDNEESVIPIEEDLARALTYYVRARLMEDQGNIQMKEYWMREYNRYVSEFEDKKIWGPRMVMPRSHAIKK